jgi:hypothetical protein
MLSREPFPIRYPWVSIDVITTTPEASKLDGFLIPPILMLWVDPPIIS